MKSFGRESTGADAIREGGLPGAGSGSSIPGLLDAALAVQDGALLLIRSSGELSHACPEAAAMLGLDLPLEESSRVESIGLTPLNETFNAALRDPGQVFWADVHIRATGRYAKVRAAAILDDSGNPCGVAVFLRDTGHEHELDRMKADFLSAISHRLRTPLTSILGYSHLMIDAKDLLAHEDRLQFLQTIESQGRALLNLINDLIEIAKLDSSSFSLQLQPELPRAIVSQMAEEFTPRALAADIVLETRCPQNVPPVRCDPARVRQALSYLLDNALEFTAPGGMVRISAEQDGEHVVFSVADTGTGIEADQRGHLFEAFSRVNPGADRPDGSTGLGLAIVRKIAEVHGGSVLVETEAGRGSDFGFRLPCASTPTGSAVDDGGYPLAA